MRLVGRILIQEAVLDNTKWGKNWGKVVLVTFFLQGIVKLVKNMRSKR